MMQSSPDGSALLVVERSLQGRNLNLRVFHHGSFGEKPSGFLLPLPDEFDQAREFTVSSLGRRKHVYLIGHQPSSASLHSISLRISKTETEFGLGLKKDRTAPPKAVQTTHNSLIDCFADVWERFPIIPAIARSVLLRPLTPYFTYLFQTAGISTRIDRPSVSLPCATVNKTASLLFPATSRQWFGTLNVDFRSRLVTDWMRLTFKSVLWQTLNGFYQMPNHAEQENGLLSSSV